MIEANFKMGPKNRYKWSDLGIRPPKNGLIKINGLLNWGYKIFAPEVFLSGVSYEEYPDPKIIPIVTLGKNISCKGFRLETESTEITKNFRDS